jgi:hypothetical protein
MSSMRRSAALTACLLGLVSGCAAQYEEASRNEAPPASAELEFAEPMQDVEAAPEEAPAAGALEEAPASFEDLQRELASNNAKLRALGVALPVEQPDPAKSKETSGSGVGGTISPVPGGQPSAKPSKAEREPDEKPRRDKDKGGAKPKDDSKLDLDDGVRPEEAKAAPLSPNHELDPEARCQQVCDLSAISCGLGDQICELADRHPDELDYVSACERANADCEAAKEACDACVE